jgi:dye decolorizing peroxidase
MTVAHAVRVLVKDTRSFTSVRWTQRGFRRSQGSQPADSTQHNLMGQLDGTANPQTDSAAFAKAVWVTDGPDWFKGGTTLVVRRIRMNLDDWDAADREAREFALGRKSDTGAPLTGRAEHDPLDLGATDRNGFPVISEFAHVRLAHASNPADGIYRRPYNYDDGVSDVGLIFASYQADINRQFLPIQQRLADKDLLNKWTTPIGSAVFAIPPGCEGGSWIGSTLLD